VRKYRILLFVGLVAVAFTAEATATKPTKRRIRYLRISEIRKIKPCLP